MHQFILDCCGLNITIAAQAREVVVIYWSMMMREEILKNWRIPAATLFSVLLVGGSYFFARGIGSPSTAQASEETALLQAIATKDSDADGLPDWEESLYGTDPHIVDTFHLGMTDGEAVAKGLIVPKAIADITVATSTSAANTGINYAAAGITPPSEGTLTDAFAKSFFTLYIAAKQANGGADLSAADVNDIETQALDTLSGSITAAPDFKSARDLTVAAGGADALRSFAAQAEAIFNKNTSDTTKSELIYLQDAVQNNDASALAHIVSIAKAYRDAATGLAALPVPQELAPADLSLVNALMRVSEVVSDFARVNTDPLTAMIALQQYVPAAQSLGQAFSDINDAYAAEGIVLPTGTPGSSFVNVIADMAARQRAAMKNL